MKEIPEGEQGSASTLAANATSIIGRGAWACRKDEFRRAAERAGPRIGDIRQYLIGGFTTAGPTS